MTYIVDLLLAAWEQEQASDALQDLPAGIQDALTRLVEELGGELGLQPDSSLQATIIKKEIALLDYTWTDLLKIRRRKMEVILDRGDTLAGTMLLGMEKDYATAVQAAMAIHASSRLVVPATTTRAIRDQPSGLFMVVRFTEDTGAIVGMDMRSHGPFKKEDIACIPRENAVIFVDRGKARVVAT